MASRWHLQKCAFDYLITYTHTFQIAVEEDTSMLKHLRWEYLPSGLAYQAALLPTGYIITL